MPKAALQWQFYLAIPKGTGQWPGRNFVCFGSRQTSSTKESQQDQKVQRACSYAPKSRPPFPHLPGARQRRLPPALLPEFAKNEKSLAPARRNRRAEEC